MLDNYEAIMGGIDEVRDKWHGASETDYPHCPTIGSYLFGRYVSWRKNVKVMVQVDVYDVQLMSRGRRRILGRMKLAEGDLEDNLCLPVVVVVERGEVHQEER